MTKKNPLRGEERKIVSTRVYRSEFANFIKICKAEGNKSVNTKIREMIKEEIERKLELSNKKLLIKMREDKEKLEEKIRSKQKEWNFEIKEIK